RRTAIARRGPRLVLRNRNRRKLAVVHLFEVDQIATRSCNRDTHWPAAFGGFIERSSRYLLRIGNLDGLAIGRVSGFIRNGFVRIVWVGGHLRVGARTHQQRGAQSARQHSQTTHCTSSQVIDFPVSALARSSFARNR